MMANLRAEHLLKIPAEPSPELRIPGAAAQTRVVSLAGIRLGSWESARAFKGIICDDISEFESRMLRFHSKSAASQSRLQRYLRQDSAVAVCCCNDSLRSVVRWRSSLSRRAPSISLSSACIRASSRHPNVID